MQMKPANYEAWYHTKRGQWIADTEFSLILRLMHPKAGSSLLDVGSGTGYFSRRFAKQGFQVTGIDSDQAAINYAVSQGTNIDYVNASALTLPFANQSFDYCTAITSLCFIQKPDKALNEMWRVSRKGIFLGLLNRNSLLYYTKEGKGAYRGARWDTLLQILQWNHALQPNPIQMNTGSVVFFPGGHLLARLFENLLSTNLKCGGFLGIYLKKNVE